MVLTDTSSATNIAVGDDSTVTKTAEISPHPNKTTTSPESQATTNSDQPVEESCGEKLTDSEAAPQVSPEEVEESAPKSNQEAVEANGENATKCEAELKVPPKGIKSSEPTPAATESPTVSEPPKGDTNAGEAAEKSSTCSKIAENTDDTSKSPASDGKAANEHPEASTASATAAAEATTSHDEAVTSESKSVVTPTPIVETAGEVENISESSSKKDDGNAPATPSTPAPKRKAESEAGDSVDDTSPDKKPNLEEGTEQ